MMVWEETHYCEHCMEGFLKNMFGECIDRAQITREGDDCKKLDEKMEHCQRCYEYTHDAASNLVNWNVYNDKENAAMWPQCMECIEGFHMNGGNHCQKEEDKRPEECKVP